MDVDASPPSTRTMLIGRMTPSPSALTKEKDGSPPSKRIKGRPSEDAGEIQPTPGASLLDEPQDLEFAEDRESWGNTTGEGPDYSDPAPGPLSAIGPCSAV